MLISVIGGGIIGLATAWRLARDGHQVTLLDAAAEAREASWAAGGMLAPHHECASATPLWRMGCASLARWPSFLEQAGIAAEAADFRQDGGLVPLVDAEDRAAAERQERFLRTNGVPCTWLDGAALRRAEPALAVTAALLLPGAQVDPRRATAALATAAAAAGVEVRYASPVERLVPGTVLLSTGERIPAAQVVLAAGAWTPALAALAGIPLAGEPVKGQMLRLDAPEGLLGRFLHSHRAYLIPRAGQGVVVGATMVDAGFDRGEDATAILALHRGAAELVPELAGARIAETWTGLRPRLHGGLPCIARVREDLVLATGHFRNGILLAPATADAVATIIAGGPGPEGMPCPAPT